MISHALDFKSVMRMTCDGRHLICVILYIWEDMYVQVYLHWFCIYATDMVSNNNYYKTVNSFTSAALHITTQGLVKLKTGNQCSS